MVVQENQAVDQLIVTGKYADVAQRAEARMGLKPGRDGKPAEIVFKPANVLDHLEAAEAWRLAGDLERALAHYDAAESALSDVDTENRAAQGGRQVGAVLLNDLVLNYKPSPAESVLINYYKSLIFIQNGDHSNARVELNRAADRIRRAEERYAAELREAQKEAADQSKPRVALNDPSVGSVLSTHFPEMQRWKPYAVFDVPAANYLNALFLSRSSDAADQQRARDALQRVVGVTGNAVAANDYRELSRGRLCPKRDCIWIVGEYGQGPHLVERRFALPVPTSNGLVTLSMALPALESRSNGAPPAFQIYANSTALGLTELMSMDQVVQTEFKKRFPGIVTRSVMGAVVKAVAQESVNREAGPIAGLFANLLAIGTTSADVRMWRSMPGHVAVARLDRNAAQRLVLRHAGGEELLVLPENGPVLIHVKQPDARAKPVIAVVSL